MFKTRKIAIGSIFRWLLGMLGLIACFSGAVVFLDHLQRILNGNFFAAPIAAFALIIIAGGVALLRSASRGRLLVRAYDRKRR